MVRNKFKENKYLVIKNIISKELASFLYKYLQIKKQSFYTMKNANYFSPFDEHWETWGTVKDPMVPGTYSCYCDMAMDTLLLMCQKEIEKKTNLKLIPTYSFTRLYKKGDELKRHKDRKSCEITTTLFLGGDPWPIYLETDKKHGIFDGQNYFPGETKGKKIDLNQGDILIYYGSELEHWREKFDKKECGQVFFHFNNFESENSNIYDGRPHMGLPSAFQNFYKRG